MEQQLAGFGRSPGRLRHPHCPRHTTDSPGSWHCPRLPGSRRINHPQHGGFASSVGSKTTGQELAQPPRLPARPVAPTGPRQPLWVWVCPGGHTMTMWVTPPCLHPPCWSSPSPGAWGPWHHQTTAGSGPTHPFLFSACPIRRSGTAPGMGEGTRTPPRPLSGGFADISQMEGAPNF